MSVPNFRIIFCWTFALASAVCAAFLCGLVLRMAHIQIASIPARNLFGGSLFAASLVVLPSLAAVVFGAAWWSLWKQKRRAKEWGITASALLFLIWTPMIFFGWNIFWGFERAAWYVPAIGAIGLIVFLRPGDSTEVKGRTHSPEGNG